MRVITTPANQSGALVSLEYAILMIVSALSAITLGLLLSGHFSEIVMAWILSVVATVPTTPAVPPGPPMQVPPWKHML